MLKIIDKAYIEIAEAIEKLEFKEASALAMKLIEDANKYYDEERPWIAFKEDKEKFNNIIYTCTVLIANIANIMEPFMPFSSAKIRKILNIEKASWKRIEVEPGIKLENIEPLFVKFDIKK